MWHPGYDRLMGSKNRHNRLRVDPSGQGLRSRNPFEPAAPLWARVPTRTPEGRLASDFMMLIPGLRRRPQDQLQRVLDNIHGVLTRYHHVVLFADINLKLNVLWISVRPVPGITLELAAAVKLRVPEALLISSRLDAYAR